MTAEVPRAQYTSNGSRTTLSRFAESADRTLGRLLSMLGQPDRSTLVVERIPDGVHFDDMPGRDEPFLQAAGTAEAMTIEWGRRRDDGSWSVATLGREGDSSDAPDVAIAFNADGVSLVHEHEMFDADEAAGVFKHFVRTGIPPAQYQLRELSLASEQKP